MNGYKWIVPLTACTAALLFTGCSAFSVRADKEKNASLTNGKADTLSVPGVPFYKKVGVWKHETKRTRTWVQVDLTIQAIDAESKPAGSPLKRTFFIQPQKFDEGAVVAAFDALKAGLDAGNTATSDLLRNFGSSISGNGMNTQLTWADIEAETGSTVPAPSSPKLAHAIISNVISLESRVDYSRPYYFNSSAYPFTSTTAGFELNADGTLTKGNATVDTTKLSEAIPFNDYLKKVLHLTAPAAAGGLSTMNVPINPGAKPVQLTATLSISTSGFEYTITRFHDSEPSSYGALDVSANALVSRAPLESGDEKKEKKDDGKQLSFQGSVTLPK